MSPALDELNLLRTFVAVAQFASFTAAADRAFVEQLRGTPGA